MMHSARRAMPALGVIGAIAGSTHALACGFHDATSVQRGVLNFLYPDALHVSGATWALQQAGRLPMPDRRRLSARGEERAKLDAAAYWKARAALTSLGTEMQARQTAPHVAALVLVGPMLWMRYETTDRDRIDQSALRFRGAPDSALLLHPCCSSRRACIMVQVTGMRGMKA